VTDAFGFALLLPFSRRAMVRWLMRRGTWQAYGDPRGAAFHFEARGQSGGRARTGPQVYRARDGSRVIEGEFEREDERDDDRDRLER
jgi:Protein affecting phage T7 exclusion by the F plasmid